ncbi:MAG: DEAD/DEAH box helicase [Calditrichaeota bacterium]|nr:DEAD/DEAH box helicase [Calditrichota bacterium]
MKEHTRFADLGISPDILRALDQKGFVEPTPIQQQVIQLLFHQRRDLIGRAPTGTGKTAAFGIPIIEGIREGSPHVQVIILVPVRELAIQVAEEFNSLKGKKHLRIFPVYGGQSMELQLRLLNRGVDIVVGTPGRIIDHLNRGSLDLSRVDFVVLDEADEMLNMGFIDDVERILSHTNPERTTLLFSATVPPEIRAIASRHMKDYQMVHAETEKITVDLTEQVYYEVASRDKLEALCRIIEIESDFYGLVFCRTRADVDQVAMQLTERGYHAEALHGDISQTLREKILNKFKRRRLNVLVATDVAARGIDILNLSHVINYSLPQDPDSYVHRIGRTGRAGRPGKAITFVTPEERRRWVMIQKKTRTRPRKETLPRVRDILAAKREHILQEVRESLMGDIEERFLRMAENLLQENVPERALAAVLQQVYQNAVNANDFEPLRGYLSQSREKRRLFIARGKKDGFTKRKLVQFILSRANVDDRKIDNVQVFDSYSFITVPPAEAEHILRRFRESKNGRRPLVELAKPEESNRRFKRKVG